MAIRAVLLALAAAAVSFVAADAVLESELPVFFFHGITGNATNGRNIKANLTAEGRVFVGLTFCENECSVQSVTAQIPLAIAEIRGIVANDSRFDNGYHFVGHSQGGGIARAVVENMDDHKVHSLVSLAGMQNGMFYGPQAEDVVPLYIMINVLGPQLLTTDTFDFSNYTTADWRGKIQHDLAVLDANHELQSKYSLMNMNREPADAYFIENNKYLPYLNNLNVCADNDLSCLYDKLRRKANFLRLKSAHFLAGPNDGVVAPWQHSLLQRYTPVDSVDEIETKFEEFTIMEMEDTIEYKNDTYGLRALDERGNLHRTSVANVSHNCWIVSGTRFDADVWCKCGHEASAAFDFTAVQNGFFSFRQTTNMSSPIYGASPYRHQASGPKDSPPPVLQPTAPPADEAPPVKRECNDFIFLLPFLAVVIVTIVFAAKYGDEFIDATQVQGLSESSGVKLMLRIVGLSALASAGMSVVWIAVMVLLAEVLIWVALITIIALNIAAAIFLTKKAYDSGSDVYWWPAVVFGLMALLTTLYVCCIRRRIKFAAAHLKVAGKAIFRLPMTLLVVLVTVGVQIGWAVLWVLGSLGLMFHEDYIKVEDTCTVDKCDLTFKTGAIIGVLCGMLLIYFWVTFVLRNIIGVTTAGTVAAWKNAANTPFITLSAWLRAVTLNLGSICFGSLIVAILETVVWILHILAWLAGRSGNCCLACLLSCLSCIISCIESWIEFFNRFAYSYVGCYGYSFVTASRHVFKLFVSKGWSAIVNDDLTGNVFWLGNIIIGAVTAYVGVQIVDDTDSSRLAMFSHPHVFVAFFCFVVGYGINNLFMSVVASAVTTIFVLWAEDPHGWQLTRPKHYETLHKAWLKIYPDEYNNGYGKQVDGHV
ncbi:hypothetical protein BBJ29_003969 [Phytophthora kernoviae]|uniref:Uncharacterized protein n=1 Tax=Phytophthora kernoviae TaxID=325452 RepID=A0A3F2RKH8_9STRA|nr:hypothetical protein BBP00_00006679 [Phytophthora kernoviae]RLN71894.1 hypothetical protein BBJ29_003969 [Phytophthora kernoviae]